MEKNSVFTYTYSAVQSKEIQEIRSKYMPERETKYEEIKRLDNRVRFAGMVEALSNGIIGCLLLSIALCMGFNVISGDMLWAVILGVVGTATMLGSYPVYRKRSEKVKAHYAPKILQLAEEIEKNQ